MKIDRITSQILANSAAERWKEQYFKDGKWNNVLFENSKSSAKTIYIKLLALGDYPNPSDIDKITGNTSWTTKICDFCENNASVQISGRIEFKKCSICKNCLDKVLRMI